MEFESAEAVAQMTAQQTAVTPAEGSAAVITVSDRVSRGSAADGSGQLAADMLVALGYRVALRVAVPDEIPAISAALHGALGHDVVVLTGGTGLGPRDVTPEAVQPMLDKSLPGIGEAIRAASRGRVPTTDLSRICAGAIGASFVLALPGSTGGVRDGLSIAGPLLGHAVHVLKGGDHGAR